MFSLKIHDELCLELINYHRAPEVFSIIEEQNAYLSEWMAWPPHTKEIEHYKNFIKDSLHKYADGKSLVCFILYKSNVVGCIGFNYIDLSLKKVEIGYWLSQHAQGKGIMTSSCKFLIDWAFEYFDIDKVEIPVSEGNMPSRGVCERLGFVQEGVITNAENLNGRIANHIYYAMLRENWKQI
ncbi:GNAT family N-acetyltransferase [Glaciecola sp. 2405UD65-10]|uniref:GNAT family N-acetyltransferase n=1 Tax=Glaciecola sp. 2405UD65-10 TaxID=3397244 RepID=UPI003B5C4AAC